MNLLRPAVYILIAATALCWLAAVCGCRSGSDQVVVVFHAASLSGVLARVEQRLEKRTSGLDIRLEPSGSQVAARKVVELNRKADLVLVADGRIIERLLVPDHARFCLSFATNEIVLAHAAHSRHTDEITADNWHEILLRPGVRLGRGDENLAPIGYHTLLAWQLAEQQGPQGDLMERLKARVPPEQVTPDIAELVSLLESRAVDYAFVFRSMAEEHKLKITSLPDGCNLSRPALAGAYARARVQVHMKSSGQSVEISGAPILYGLTIPKSAEHAEAARRVIAFLLGPEGRRLLLQFGLRPMSPESCDPADRLPADLQASIGGKAAK